MQCRKCSSTMPDEAKFCSSCGTTTAAQESCYKCGVALAPSDSFCIACGTKVGSGAVILQASNLIFKIFPNLLIQNTATRSEFWASQIQAILLSVAAGFVALLISDAMFSSWELPKLLSNLALLYTYIRLCGHTINSRLLDTGLVTSLTLKKYGVYAAIFFVLSPVIFSGKGQVLQIIFSIVLFLICGIYPSKSNHISKIEPNSSLKEDDFSAALIPTLDTYKRVKMSKRPTSISVISWILIVSGVVSIVAPISFDNPMTQDLMSRSPIPIRLQYIMMNFGLFAQLISGIAMLNCKNWGRLLYTFGWVIGLSIGLITYPTMKAMLTSGVVFLAVIVFFLFNPKANEYFKQGSTKSEHQDA